MVDELNQKEGLPEILPGDRNPPEVEELVPSAVSEPLVKPVPDKAQESGGESVLAQENEELAKAEARLRELEQIVANRESEMATLKQTNAELEGRLATIGNSLAEAVASYKAAVVQANPEVIGELITGDTIEAINESMVKAKTLVSRVRQGVEAEISLTMVPAGAPERTAPDLSALSPREKIQYAMGSRK